MKKNQNKLKKIIATAITASLLFVGQAQAISVSQSDLYTDDNARYILTLKEHGVYDGFTDAQLSSREYIKNEEMITLFVKYLDKLQELSLDKIPSIYGEQGHEDENNGIAENQDQAKEAQSLEKNQEGENQETISQNESGENFCQVKI